MAKITLQSMPLCSSNYILCFQALTFIIKVYSWLSYAKIIRNICQIRIFNFSILCIWLNPTYIIPIFCQTILSIYRANGKTLCYHKRDFIWRLIFLFSLVIYQHFISDFIFIVKTMFILVCVISNNLRLFLLTY